MTFEELLRTKHTTKNINDEEINVTPDYRIAVQEETEEGVRIIVHPMDYNGETLDLIVKGNEVKDAFSDISESNGSKGPEKQTDN